jgi:hypothetical protein
LAGWKTGYIDRGDVLGWLSLALRAGSTHDTPHIAYTKIVVEGGKAYELVMHASPDQPDGSFTLEQVVRVVSTEGHVGRCSIDVSLSGVVHIAYNHSTGDASAVEAVRQEAGAWNRDTVLGGLQHDQGSGPAIAIDSQGVPHIAFTHDSGRLEYARLDGSVWRKELLHNNLGKGGGFASIDIAPDGSPHISCYSADKKAVLAFRLSASGWNGDTVAPDVGKDGGGTSIVVDSAGVPHIAYRDGQSDALAYAKLEGSTWNRETVDADAKIGRYMSIALTSKNDPLISYYDQDHKRLMFAAKRGTLWSTEIVDPDAGVNHGEFSSIRVDRVDIPRIAYYEGGRGDLLFAHRT